MHEFREEKGNLYYIKLGTGLSLFLYILSTKLAGSLLHFPDEEVGVQVSADCTARKPKGGGGGLAIDGGTSLSTADSLCFCKWCLQRLAIKEERQFKNKGQVSRENTWSLEAADLGMGEQSHPRATERHPFPPIVPP